MVGENEFCRSEWMNEWMWESKAHFRFGFWLQIAVAATIKHTVTKREREMEGEFWAWQSLYIFENTVNRIMTNWNFAAKFLSHFHWPNSYLFVFIFACVWTHTRDVQIVPLNNAIYKIHGRLMAIVGGGGGKIPCLLKRNVSFVKDTTYLLAEGWRALVRAYQPVTIIVIIIIIIATAIIPHYDRIQCPTASFT